MACMTTAKARWIVDKPTYSVWDFRCAVAAWACSEEFVTGELEALDALEHFDPELIAARRRVILAVDDARKIIASRRERST